MSSADARVHAALDTFRIEVPSWGFANSGTRFGQFPQPAAAVTLEEKFSDAGHVHALTGVCPTLALHVLWDVPDGAGGAAEIDRLSALYGVRAGSINPNLFQDQQYKFGSFGNPEAGVRAAARQHVVDSIALARVLRCRDVSLWFADGSNYPGTANIRQRRAWFIENLRASHAALGPDQRLLVEYKPFEPAFYHTDIADWGMALLLARAAGPQARVLVDTGHHYPSQNIEQIVAWLLAKACSAAFISTIDGMQDDDLTLGSIDPYQVFRIFHEIRLFEHERGTADMAFMIDQSHNLKGAIEAMIQTVVMAQALYAKAALVDYDVLLPAQGRSDLVRAE
jgi:L-rhamnose isomerase/sugar isomerase